MPLSYNEDLRSGPGGARAAPDRAGPARVRTHRRHRSEPAEGEQTNPDEAAQHVREALRRSLLNSRGITASELIKQRYAKFRGMGNFFTETSITSLSGSGRCPH